MNEWKISDSRRILLAGTINERRERNPPHFDSQGAQEQRADDEFSIWLQHLRSIMRFLRRMTGTNAKHQTSWRKKERMKLKGAKGSDVGWWGEIK